MTYYKISQNFMTYDISWYYRKISHTTALPDFFKIRACQISSFSGRFFPLLRAYQIAHALKRACTNYVFTCETELEVKKEYNMATLI